MKVVGLALEAHQAPGQLVELGGIAAYVAEQRDRFGRNRGGFADETDDLLHLRTEFTKLIKVDRPGRGQHFIDRVVQGTDERRDRTAIERGQESPANRGQHLPDDVVGLMLPIPNDLENLARRVAVGRKLLQRFRRANHRCRMRFEHAEEIARLGQ